METTLVSFDSVSGLLPSLSPLFFQICYHIKKLIEFVISIFFRFSRKRDCLNNPENFQNVQCNKNVQFGCFVH